MQLHTQQTVTEKPFNHKDYYQGEQVGTFGQLLVRHLLNRFEHEFGVLVVIRDGVPMYHGVAGSEFGRDMLFKSLKYYNISLGIPGTSAHWFYVEDLQKHLEE